MSLGAINNSYKNYEAVNTAASKKTETSESKKTASAADKSGVTYETTAADKKAKNAAIVAQLKADADKRASQMQDLVTNMFKKQGITVGTADEMWRILASGKFTADADTIAQAKEDISEDGYWGVKQTSERIFSFALALSNGDEKTMQKMVKAVEKGFGAATKAWGKELPSITKDTHSAIMDKFDNWFKEHNSDVTTADLLK